MMDVGNFGINNANDSQNIADRFGGMSSLRGNEGKIDGMDVKLEDPLSAIEDSAEELTFARDNSKKMKLADRKQKGADIDLYSKMAVFLKIANLMHNADYDARKRIIDRASEYRGNVKRLLSDMSKLGGNKVHDFVALQNAASNSSQPEISEFLKNASEQLLSEHRSEILSVLNTIEEAEHSNLGDACELSERYSELSNTCKAPEEMLRYIEEKFGSDRIDEGVDFMLKALGADLSSPTVSQEPALLENIGTNLSMVRTLNSVKGIVTSFTSRLEKAHGLNHQVSVSKIMNGLISMSKQKFISPSAIRELYGNVPNQRPDIEVLMAQDMLAICRKLGDEFFDNDDARVRLLSATETLVDQLIDQEDVWLENGGGQ